MPLKGEANFCQKDKFKNPIVMISLITMGFLVKQKVEHRPTLLLFGLAIQHNLNLYLNFYIKPSDSHQISLNNLPLFLQTCHRANHPLLYGRRNEIKTSNASQQSCLLLEFL